VQAGIQAFGFFHFQSTLSNTWAGWVGLNTKKRLLKTSRQRPYMELQMQDQLD
jgi:hypothetical protein